MRCRKYRESQQQRKELQLSMGEIDPSGPFFFTWVGFFNFPLVCVGRVQMRSLYLSELMLELRRIPIGVGEQG